MVVLLGRPQSTVKQYESQWKQMLFDVNGRTLVPCPSSDYKLETQQQITDNEHGAKESPLVTVVITHYNRHKLLQQAIESLEGQTMKNFEVILVDDGSTDPEAKSFLQELSWRWWRERAWRVQMEPNRYLGAARNTGAKLARGKYVLFMDDDDIAKPNQIETMLRIAEISGADVVTTGHDLFQGKNPPNGKNTFTRYIPLGPALNSGILRNIFGDSNMLVHRQFFLDSTGFTEEYGVGFEDYEFLAKVVARDNVLVAAAEPLHWYRQHANSMSMVTDTKAGQIRFMRAYTEVNSYLPKFTQSLLRHVQNQLLQGSKQILFYGVIYVFL